MSTISYSPNTILAPSSVRLTRRGRVVVLALAMIFLFAIGLALASTSSAGSDAGSPDVTVVTVHPGETLWQIASHVADQTGHQTGEMVQRIEDLNPINDGVVYAGQELRVPTN